jgi:hypothetical protein
VQTAIDDNAATNAGAQDRPENHPISPPCAGQSFGEDKAVRIVRHEYEPPQAMFQVRRQSETIDAGNIGARHHLRHWIDDAGDRDGKRGACRRASGEHLPLDRSAERLKIVEWRLHPS